MHRVLRKLLRRRKPAIRVWVTLGGQTVGVNQLGIQEGIELCLLVAPYLPVMRSVVEVLDREGEARGKVTLLRELAKEMGEFPGDLIKVVGLMVGKDPNWVATNATAAELFEVLGVLNEFHRIWEMVIVGQQLGIIRFGDNEDA